MIPFSKLAQGDILDSIRRYYRMDRTQIHYFRFLLEAYEGVAVLTTLDQTAGLVMLRIAPGREKEASQLVTQLRKEIMIEPVTGDSRRCSS